MLKKGKLILAPIRTGLGLRLGASVGYLKFTPDAEPKSVLIAIRLLQPNASMAVAA